MTDAPRTLGAPPSEGHAKVSTHQRVIDWLSADITDRDVQVGERLPTEREIAVQCDVSRASVRQALAALQALGIVRVRHGDGCYLVQRPEDRQALAALLTRQRPLDEVLEARTALEVTLARLAAERRTESDLRDVAAALELMEDELAAGAPGEAGDQAFHQAVTAAAQNSLLAELIDHLGGDLGRVRTVSLTTPGRPARSLAQHREIAAAPPPRDPAAAERAMREHIQAIVELVVPEDDDRSDQ
jgi:GntR family transcriptional regulator, transcriptional repressor for pyruvate dehydrogenase complex